MPDNCDVLIHAGDFTRYGKKADAIDFNDWLGTLTHIPHKFVILGNHEATAEWEAQAEKLLSNAMLLRNRGVSSDALSLYGTEFYWPAGPDDVQPPYGQIPPSIDVLVCHSPVQGHVDGGMGCPSLLKHVHRVKPKLVVCGHIHEARGIVQGVGDFEGTIFVNAANLVASRDRGGSSKKSGVRPAILWDRENGAVEMALPESA